MSIKHVSQTTAGSLRERWGIAAFAVGLVLVVGATASGVFSGCRRVEAQQNNSSGAFVVTGVASPSPSASPAAKDAKEIVVYVTGAVKRPGIYTLPPNARLYHAIRAAGGFKPNAVTDSINLADLAMDGDQISIPARKSDSKTAAVVVSRPIILHKTAPVAPVVVTLPGYGGPTIAKGDAPKPGRILGEPEPILSEPSVPALHVAESQPLNAVPGTPNELNPRTLPASGSLAPVVSVKTEPKVRQTAAPRPTKFKNIGDGVVRLNSATAEELEQLPRCGKAMAEKVISYRTEHGGFSSTKQLLDIKGIGDKTYAEWQPFLSL